MSTLAEQTVNEALQRVEEADQKASRSQAAFATGQGAAGNRTQVRDAGPEAMRDPAQRRWTKVDENSDQSFPASDPPATY